MRVLGLYNIILIENLNFILEKSLQLESRNEKTTKIKEELFVSVQLYLNTIEPENIFHCMCSLCALLKLKQAVRQDTKQA